MEAGEQGTPLECLIIIMSQNLLELLHGWELNLLCFLEDVLHHSLQKMQLADFGQVEEREGGHVYTSALYPRVKVVNPHTFIKSHDT